MTPTTILMNDLHPDSHLQAKLDMAYDRVMSSGRYIGGAEVEAFEKEWAEYIGVKHCIACGNGFDALQLVLRAVGADTYEYVRASEKTFLATWQAIRVAGGYPAPMDVPDLGVTLVVHLYGIVQPLPNMDGELSYWLIEDAAQAHGATWKGKKAGSLGSAGCWSFYPTKNLGCYGDGGAITTDNEYIADTVRNLRAYGGVRTGINSRMDPLQAAFLRAKLSYLDEWNDHRRVNASKYMQELAGIPGLQLPKIPPECKPCWYQFAVHAERRDALKAHLSQYGIETLVHYPVPPHRLIGTRYDLPEVDDWAAHALSLPIAPHVAPEDIGRVCEYIQRFYETKPAV